MTHSVKGFKELNHPICFKDGAKNVFIKYKDLMSLLTTFEDDVFMKWNQSITKKINLSLSKSLLYRDIKKGVLRVNFGKDLGAMLREVCMYHDFIINIYILVLSVTGYNCSKLVNCSSLCKRKIRPM